MCPACTLIAIVIALLLAIAAAIVGLAACFDWLCNWLDEHIKD